MAEKTTAIVPVLSSTNPWPDNDKRPYEPQPGGYPPMCPDLLFEKNGGHHNGEERDRKLQGLEICQRDQRDADKPPDIPKVMDGIAKDMQRQPLCL